MPTALACLAADKDLEQLRFGLVPRKLKEDKFWRNYFYHVSLLKAAYAGDDGEGGPPMPQARASPDKATAGSGEATEDAVGGEGVAEALAEVSFQWKNPDSY